MKSKLTGSQILILALILVLVINCITHLSSPAYREYRKQSDLLREDYSNFVFRVQQEFLPVLFLYATNTTHSTVSSLETLPPLKVDSSLEIPDYHFSRVDGRPYVRLYGQNYTLGDLWGNSRFIEITPIYSRTEYLIFRRPSTRDKEVTANDNS